MSVFVLRVKQRTWNPLLSGSTRALRSGCDLAIPESITATVTGVVAPAAATQPQAASADILVSAHCSAYSGSFGCAAWLIAMLRSTVAPGSSFSFSINS